MDAEYIKHQIATAIEGAKIEKELEEYERLERELDDNGEQ